MEEEKYLLKDEFYSLNFRVVWRKGDEEEKTKREGKKIIALCESRTSMSRCDYKIQKTFLKMETMRQ